MPGTPGCCGVKRGPAPGRTKLRPGGKPGSKAGASGVVRVVTELIALPDSFVSTRDTLQHVAVHIVARARSQAVDRIGLRAMPGGFGTPMFGADAVRVRVTGGLLVRESEGPDGSTNEATEIDGATLRSLAVVARVDLDAELNVGHDTPPLGDVSAPLSIDDEAAAALADWYAITATALDRVVVALPADASPSVVQLWPEHFDVALDAAGSPAVRVNLGGSPGDGFDAEPYAYVGPWTDDRPGDAEFWNAPFGAVLSHGTIVGDPDPVARLTEFFLAGTRRLAR